MAKGSNKEIGAPETPSTAPIPIQTTSLASVRAKWRYWLQIGLIATAVLAIYGPILRGGWLWDDDVDITANAITKSPTGLWNIWFAPGSQLDYYPIKASVQWAQWHLWGMDTPGYHLTNILLHLISALLVWHLLDKFKLKFAWWAGLLFAIHPVNVESVAWIAELKNTLSLPPFLLALCAWIDYEEQGRRRDYFLTLGFFLIAMLCKTTMVMFPFVALLYAWWKRGAIGWRDLRAISPFFVISLILGLVTLECANWYFEQHHQEIHPVQIGLLSHFTLAGLSLAFYFSKSLWPMSLSVNYAKWTVDPPSIEQCWPWILGLGFVCWFWTKRHSCGRHALLGLGFYTINLVPVLGFTDAAYMGFTWVMDHFLYLPIIGLIGLIVAEWERMDDRLPQVSRPYATGVVVIIMGLLTFESCAYASIFKDETTLWTYVCETIQIPGLPTPISAMRFSGATNSRRPWISIRRLC